MLRKKCFSSTPPTGHQPTKWVLQLNIYLQRHFRVNNLTLNDLLFYRMEFYCAVCVIELDTLHDFEMHQEVKFIISQNTDDILYFSKIVSLQQNIFLVCSLHQQCCSSPVINLDLVNQNCGENLTEPQIDFDINDGSNQRIVMTGDKTKESCHIVSLFMQY